MQKFPEIMRKEECENFAKKHGKNFAKKRKFCEKTPNFEKITEFSLADSSNSLHRTFNKVKEEKLLK